MFKKKFNLIELLVVITILSILIALLMPSLNRSKERSLGISCINNIRNLSIPYLLYQKDNSNNLIGADTGKVNHDWVRAGNTDYAITNGKLFTYVNSRETYRCPKDFRWDRFRTVRSDYFWRAFSINGFLNGERKHDPEGVRKLSQVKKGYDSVLLFAEEQDPRGYNMNSFFLKRPPHTLVTWVNADWMAPLHLKGYNISFLDGHAEYIKTLEPLSIYASLYSGVHVPASNIDRQKLFNYHFAR